MSVDTFKWTNLKIATERKQRKTLIQLNNKTNQFSFSWLSGCMMKYVRLNNVRHEAGAVAHAKWLAPVVWFTRPGCQSPFHIAGLRQKYIIVAWRKKNINFIHLLWLETHLLVVSSHVGCQMLAPHWCSRYLATLQ